MVLTISIKYVVHRAQYSALWTASNLMDFHENHMTVTVCNEIIHQEEPERLAAI